MVAKDDLGNWMVKSVGTNVAGIAKTALNLAMFNLGQRVDTNFLRAQQIRLELDDPELDPGRRSALEGELKAAQISAAGGIGKQGDLAKDLKSAFDVDALAAHESLRAALTGFRPGRELALIWMQSLDGSSAKAASDWRTRVAQPTTQGPAVLREAYQRVLTKVQITPANAWEANEAILTSLRALDEYRRELRLAVRADEALVADESTRLQLAKAELARLEALAAASQPSGTPTAGVGAPPAPTPGASTPSTGNAAAAPVAAQPTGAAVPAAGTGSAAADFEAAKAQVKLAQTALDDARQRREAAAKETDAIFLAEMKKVVGTRISALERHRTAFDAFGGQGAKQSTTKEADAK
ncbi:MAG: hypothetical protein R3E83_07795 [Burkholderiaceae bacterium]